MVKSGEADGFLGELAEIMLMYYVLVWRLLVVMQIATVIGCYMMVVKGRLIFLGDATVNVYPDSKTLADIAVQTAKVAEDLA